MDRSLPAGRTLHLVDIENLIGGEQQYRSTVELALERYVELVPVIPGDLVVIAASPALVLRVGLAWPSARLVAACGMDGADLALLGEVSCAETVASRFDRLMIGSGDGIFADAIVRLRRLGIAVGVVAPIGGLALSLYRVATFVRVIHPQLKMSEVA